MAEKNDPAVHRLISALGPENVLLEEENIVVRPSSTLEVAEVINIALKEKISVEALKYYVGPTVPPVQGKRIVLSLDRMNKTNLDRDRLCFLVEPAAETGEIIKIAMDSGLNFPGITCQHKGITIGENVAACFIKGEPHFNCHAACLCGLEMVLFDGSILNLGESTAKDLDNYQLSYALAGYSQDKAVITGVHLKLSTFEIDQFWLASLNKDLGNFLEVLPSIIQTHSDHLQRVVAFKSGYALESSGMLKEILPSSEDAGAFVLFTFDGSFSTLEPALNQIAESCSKSGSSGAFVAGESYQKFALPAIFDALLEKLESDTSLFYKYAQKNELNQKKQTDHLIAVIWRKDGNLLKKYHKK